MDPVHRQAIVQGVLGTLLFVVLIIGSAGTLHYWQGWLFVGIFTASTTGFTMYLAIYDRPLLERRMKAGPQHERELSQKIIMSLVLLVFFASLVAPVLDYRYAWSRVAPSVSELGDVVVLLSFLFFLWVTWVNRFRRIQHSRGERSESDRHRTVRVRTASNVRRRHLALRRNAARARLVVVDRPHRAFHARALVAASRRGEDSAERPAGYAAYMHRVRFRLVPLVW